MLTESQRGTEQSVLVLHQEQSLVLSVLLLMKNSLLVLMVSTLILTQTASFRAVTR